MPVLLLIRHAEPEANGVFLGQLDPPLSALGRQQGAAALSHIEVKVAYSSPLQRARETAGFIRAEQVVELGSLQEIDYGLWTGKTWHEIQKQWSELADRKSRDWLGVAPPQGEAWAHFLERVRAAWQVIQIGPTPAAIVAHQGVNAALAFIIAGRNPIEFMQQHAEVIRVEYHR